MGELMGVLLELGLLAEADDLEVDDLRSRLAELAEAFESGAVATEVPAAIQQSLEGIDVIAANLGPPTVTRVAPVAAADVVRGPDDGADDPDQGGS